MTTRRVTFHAIAALAAGLGISFAVPWIYELTSSQGPFVAASSVVVPLFQGDQPVESIHVAVFPRTSVKQSVVITRNEYIPYDGWPDPQSFDRAYRMPAAAREIDVRAARYARRTFLETRGDKEDFPAIPYWVHGTTLPPLGTPIPVYTSHVGYGWPFRSVRGTMHVNAMSGYWVVPGFVPLIGGGVLPSIPIWPGVLANTLVYSTLWLAGVLSLMRLKTAVRRRRGLCPACGYDLTGTTSCPECGHGTPRPTPQ